VIFTPGRIEEMFRVVAAKKVDDVVAFARSYGTSIVGRPCIRVLSPFGRAHASLRRAADHSFDFRAPCGFA
jgi:hypothetical protein